MALKLDMSKAYDKVEWGFLERFLNAMNFPMTFTQLIMHCVSLVTYAILINGQPIDYFSPHIEVLSLTRRSSFSLSIYPLC